MLPPLYDRTNTTPNGKSKGKTTIDMSTIKARLFKNMNNGEKNTNKNTEIDKQNHDSGNQESISAFDRIYQKLLQTAAAVEMGKTGTKEKNDHIIRITLNVNVNNDETEQSNATKQMVMQLQTVNENLQKKTREQQNVLNIFETVLRRWLSRENIDIIRRAAENQEEISSFHMPTDFGLSLKSEMTLSNHTDECSHNTDQHETDSECADMISSQQEDSRRRSAALENHSVNRNKSARSLIDSPFSPIPRCSKRYRLSLENSDCTVMTTTESSNSSDTDVTKELSFEEAILVKRATDVASIVEPISELQQAVSERTLSTRSAINELKVLRKTLHNVQNEWIERLQALSRVSEIARIVNIVNDADVELWSSELKELQVPLSLQIIDLRSTIVREACRTLISLSTAHAVAFEPSFVFYAPFLTKGLFVTIKVISQSTAECLEALIKSLNTVQCLPPLLDAAADSHKEVREKAGVYIAQLLVQNTSNGICSSSFDPYTNIIAATIRKNIADSDKDVRSSFRRVFDAFNVCYRSETDALWSLFSPSVQKAISNDRRSLTSAVKITGQVKRKK